MGKCHAENDTAPRAGCPPLLLVSLAPSHPSLPPHQLVSSSQSRPVTEQLGEERISTFLLELEAFPCGILSKLASALGAKALSHILQLIFTGSHCLDQSQTAAPQNIQLGCRSPSPEVMGYIYTHSLKPRAFEVDISALIKPPEIQGGSAAPSSGHQSLQEIASEDSGHKPVPMGLSRMGCFRMGGKAMDKGRRQKYQ